MKHTRSFPRWCSPIVTLTLLAAGVNGSAGGDAPRSAGAAQPATTDSSFVVRGPTGLEALHLTPPPQPPIETLDSLNFSMLRAAFNRSVDRARLVALLSPTCSQCLRGASALQAVLSENDSLPLRVLVVWMHGIRTDRQVPSSLVLSRIHDRRAIQYWDPTRLLAHTMRRELPPDTVAAIADTVGGPPLIWDALALFPPGARWVQRFPMPDFSARPIGEVLDRLRVKLWEYARADSIARVR